MPSTPYHYQQECITTTESFGGRALLALEMSLGKAQPLSAKILTLDGWKRMKDIHPGSYVIGADGKPKLVLSIHPQGKKKAFKVSFTDKSSTICTEDHLWTVNTPIRKWEGKPPQISPLSELRKNLFYVSKGAKNRNHFIPMCEPVQFTHRETPIHPYVMGYLIANGCFVWGHLDFTTPDQEVTDRIEKLLPTEVELIERKSSGPTKAKTWNIKGKSRRIGNPVREAIKSLDLEGKKSTEKHIPKIYQINSVPNRIELLQGLMDGDAWVDKSGSILQYSSSSKELTKNVRDLVESLGGTARISLEKYPKYTHNGEVRIGQPSYTLTISLPPSILPFKLARKAERYKPRIKRPPNRAIDKVEELGLTECQCIRIDSPDGLYLTDRHIVTHNTCISLHYFLRHPEIERCIVVCPAYLKWMWRREAMKHIDLEAEILGTTRPPKRRGLLFRSKLLIINYDVLYKWVDWLKEYDPHLVIADEVHFCCNPGARRSKSLEALCQGVPHVLALSGTPLVTRPIEIYMPTKIVCPTLFPSFQDFADRYCNPKKVMGTWTYKGATNLEELHEKLISSCMIRKRIEDVLPDLPPKIRQVVPLDPLNATEYNEATREYLKHLKKNNLDYDKNWLTHLKRLAALSKLPQALEWIENYLKETDEKLIVFGIHYKVLDAVVERFSKIAIRVDGRVAPERREQIFEAFNTDSKLRLLAGNIDAAGTGWSCRSTSSVVFLEMPWAPGKWAQAEDRCFGNNRGLPGHPLRVWSLVAKGTCEEMLCQLLDSRQNVLSRVLDGKANEDDFNMFEALTESIQNLE